MISWSMGTVPLPSSPTGYVPMDLGGRASLSSDLICDDSDALCTPIQIDGGVQSRLLKEGSAGGFTDRELQFPQPQQGSEQSNTPDQQAEAPLPAALFALPAEQITQQQEKQKQAAQEQMQVCRAKGQLLYGKKVLPKDYPFTNISSLCLGNVRQLQKEDGECVRSTERLALCLGSPCFL